MTDSENALDDDNGSPVFITYYPEDVLNSPRDLYRTIKDATKFLNSAEGKSKGARFKRFSTPKEAKLFFEAGDAANIVPKTQSLEAVGAEPKIKYPSVPRPEFTALKKILERNDVAEFERKVRENPRLLINTNGDIAAILMEGFRMNPLHILAKTASVDVAERLFHFLHDSDYLQDLYETNKEDVQLRQSNIIKSYLNTPEKGSFDTPLHLAVKFGRVGIVNLLVKEELLDKTSKNKEEKLASECICQRYNGDDKAQIVGELKALMEGNYVALYRSLDAAKLLVTSEYPAQSVATNLHSKKYLSDLHAVAGPFSDADIANNFYVKWKKEGRMFDAERGYEQAGRRLAKDHNVKFAEKWCFLPKSGVMDIASRSGLEQLEKFLNNKRLNDQKEKRAVQEEKFTNAPRVLNFECDLDEEPGCSEEFYDAKENLDVSEDDLISGFAALSLNSPKRPIVAEDVFKTPPSTPPPVFIMDFVPTKLDDDLYSALSTVNPEILSMFPSVEAFVSKVAIINAKERIQWPGVGSPRRVQQRKQILRHL